MSQHCADSAPGLLRKIFLEKFIYYTSSNKDNSLFIPEPQLLAEIFRKQNKMFLPFKTFHDE